MKLKILRGLNLVVLRVPPVYFFFFKKMINNVAMQYDHPASQGQGDSTPYLSFPTIKYTIKT